jgi:chorismate synthase
MLRYFTTGESHGQYLGTIIEGMPSGLKVDLEFINTQMRARQQGYGRGGRQKIEQDKVTVLGGVVHGLSTGAPIGFFLVNNDFKINEMPELYRPRPGHTDLVGALKYDQGIRPVLERSSARETAMRVAIGGLCQLFLNEFGIHVSSHVIQIGPAKVEVPQNIDAHKIDQLIEGNDLRCICPKVTDEMKKAIDIARRKKDTLGGRFEVRVSGVPIGLGSHVHYERKLDARLAAIALSMQSVKAVEIGDGVDLGGVFGSEAHDELFYSKAKGYYHKTNRCGGIEGGTSNGADIVTRFTMKPISTLGQPLASVNMQSKKAEKADFERSDICAVAAGSLIGASLVAFVIADAFLEKFGGDSITEIKRNYKGYLEQIKKR